VVPSPNPLEEVSGPIGPLVARVEKVERRRPREGKVKARGKFPQPDISGRSLPHHAPAVLSVTPRLHLSSMTNSVFTPNSWRRVPTKRLVQVPATFI